MKTPHRLVSLLVATLGLSAFAARPMDDEFTHSFIAHAKYVEVSDGARLFALGDSAEAVTNKLREPDFKLSHSVWLYRHFRAEGNNETRNHFCDNLVVAFGPGQKPHARSVAAIVLANDAGVKKIEKELKQNPRYLEDQLVGY